MGERSSPYIYYVPPSTPTGKTRKLTAIMFTDIVGYTALMQKDEAEAIRVRARHRAVFEEQHVCHNGNILQYYGDGTLSVFESAVEAVSCAIDIQRGFRSGEPLVNARIGLHLGDVVFDKTEIYGDGVNVAARIESLAVAGSVLLSARLNEELTNHSVIRTASLGKFNFKNVARPVEVFAVKDELLILPQRSELQGKIAKPSKSIAVLPFMNMSSGDENEYFSDGITEEIINALTRVAGLKVTSRTSSFYFKGKNIPIPEIGRELNVSTILEGSIRFAGDQMRITIQLIDVSDDVHFWSETFDRRVDDVFAVQDEISLLVADKLREHLGHLNIGEHLVDPSALPAEPYKQYLKSRFHMLRMSKSEILEGMEILEQVIRQHPTFALAHLGMHMGYTLLGTNGLMPGFEAFEKGQPYLDKAIELDPDLPECRLNLSWIAFLQEWDTSAAYAHLSKVLERRPTVDYYQSMCAILVAEAKYTAAHTYVDTAIEMDPFSEINYHLKGYIHYCEEEYDHAIQNFSKSVSLKAGSQVSLLYWGQALIMQGKHQDSLEFFTGLDETAEPLTRIGGSTMAYSAMGDTAKADAGMEHLAKALETESMDRALLLLTLCNALLGRNEKALELMEQGIQSRLPMSVYLFVEPVLKPLRSFPLFRKLQNTVLGEISEAPEPQRKYKRSLLEPAEIVTNKAKLESLMKSERPYLDPELTLRSLADMISLPANQLSQLLNEGFDKNFSEFVNSYRLEAFKVKAQDPSLHHLTILALAYESGFNSKTVFNTYFKKAMDMTPSAYWKSVNL